jgi:phage anti-repressor protein
MINVNENGKVTAKDIYYFVEVKTQFNKWVTRCIDTADLKLNKDLLVKYSNFYKGNRFVSLRNNVKGVIDYEITRKR